MKYDLKKKAQEIGKRELAKYFQERCEEKEAEIRNANELKRMEQANGKSSIEWDKKQNIQICRKTALETSISVWNG